MVFGGAGMTPMNKLIVTIGITLLVVNLGCLFVFERTSLAQEQKPNPVAPNTISTEQAEPRSLTCEEARKLVKGQPFTYTRPQGLLGLSFGESRFQSVSATCEGVSTEGKSGKARLSVTAEIQADPSWSKQGGRPLAVDPFSARGRYVEPGTLYEFKVVGFFTLYDTGWMMDSVEVQSGQRAVSKP